MNFPKDELKLIFNTFKHRSEISSISEFIFGHINDTFLIKTTHKPYYILQRINQNVFIDIPSLIHNKVSVSKHILKRLSHLSEEELKQKVLTFIPSKKEVFYHIDEKGNYWNLMIFIDNSITFDQVPNEEIAYEGGKLFGDFLNLTNDFDVNKLIEVIPNFHKMSFRFSQFQEALKNASKKRILAASELIEKIKVIKDKMHQIEKYLNKGDIKLRVTHNDTKISNALFDSNNKGLCVIDTDTVMPGIIHYDFGDAIRTICNSAAEDEKNLDLVTFNLNFYNAYKKGFLEEVKNTLSELDIKLLPLAVKTMTFIMGIRFLTDFLNNDTYYKTKYSDHNLVRAKNQFKLIDSMSNQLKI
ncbi:phosphotransferase family enzyme [Lutibacter sp. Hel_I_33_5]|uniref:phosphotransferase enzyme family protein n=1 Tax=Lutibacter sp. Hel_I_33_5 TaxID=1566289 RepID=UPI00119E2653|nr:phosphotransferase [Lutibacter sp. Hel_I_33_5]TVZ55655.1 phosphotransferase family enzyme [Lutibacter sp. Hel_I_33_5]